MTVLYGRRWRHRGPDRGADHTQGPSRVPGRAAVATTRAAPAVLGVHIGSLFVESGADGFWWPERRAGAGGHPTRCFLARLP